MEKTMLSDEQIACKDVATSLKKGEYASIVAFAGAGKTTTLLEIVKSMEGYGAYCAFNKTVAEEAKLKMRGTRCASSTMHSTAYQTLFSVHGHDVDLRHNVSAKDVIEKLFNSVEKNKRSKFFPRVIPQGWTTYRIAYAVTRAAAKFFASDDEDILLKHAEQAVIDCVGDPATLNSEEMISRAKYSLDRLAPEILRIAEEYVVHHLLSVGRFNPDAYLKMLDLDSELRWKAFGGLDYILLDEGQDLNPVQVSIIKKTNIKTIIVGDPYQSIYSWRGAVNAMDDFAGERIYLTRSFRFGEQIANVGRKILSSRPDGGPEQRLIGAGDDLGRSVPKRAVICRTNSGIMDEAMNMIKRDLTFSVDRAEDIIADITSAVSLNEGRSFGLKGRLALFDDWSQVVEEAEAGDNGLGRLVEIVESNEAENAINIIKSGVTDDRKAQVKLITAHRAKGAEFAQVRLGCDWKSIGEMLERYEGARVKSEASEKAAMEEFNTLYVAATRAEAKLFVPENLFEAAPGADVAPPPMENSESPEMTV